MSKLHPIVVALALAAVSCRPDSFQLVRVQRSDVKVLPGAGGFLNPLTGVVSYTPQDWQERPPLAIKIGNTSPERPQAGIDRADLVYEELVEGGATRLVAVFLSQDPLRIGPVRSARFAAPVILKPLGALLGYSGGVPAVVGAVRASLVDVGAFSRSGAYHRDSARHAPYNLYTSAPDLWRGETGHPPDPLFPFLNSADDISGGGGADGKVVSFSFGTEMIRYAYEAKAGRYARFVDSRPHTVEGKDGEGKQLSFRNVLVQMVSVHAGSYNDKAGNRVNDLSLLGQGDAVLLRGGRVFSGTWKRSSVDEATRFEGNAGESFALAPGQTIIELLPNGHAVDVST